MNKNKRLLNIIKILSWWFILIMLFICCCIILLDFLVPIVMSMVKMGLALVIFYSMNMDDKYIFFFGGVFFIIVAYKFFLAGCSAFMLLYRYTYDKIYEEIK